MIFFNNVGYLGMCGHGTIGLAVTLAHMGRLGQGDIASRRRSGSFGVELADKHHGDRSRMSRATVISEGRIVEVDGLGTVRGDVAWGGNWFFLTAGRPCRLLVGERAKC